MADAVDLRSDESQLAFYYFLPRLQWPHSERGESLSVLRPAIPRFSFAFSFFSLFALAAIACLDTGRCLAQSASEDRGVLRGVVINSVTHEPIDRALVSSPD